MDQLKTPDDLSEEQLVQLFKLPDALAKACVDPFIYAMGLKCGIILHFSEATYVAGSDWIHITPQESLVADAELNKTIQPSRRLNMPLERGIDVRLSEIAWVADAPYGS